MRLGKTMGRMEKYSTMNKNEMDNAEAILLAQTMLKDYGLNAALDVLKDMEDEGSITEYERICVSEILKELNEHDEE